MDFKDLGDALRPPYHSPEGWMLEKKEAETRILFSIKQERAFIMVQRAGEMAMACLDAGDLEKGLKYTAMIERLIRYQGNLYDRYPFV